MLASYVKSRSAAFLLTICLSLGVGAHAQSGSSTSITGTVVDPSGAVVPTQRSKSVIRLVAFLEMQ